MIYFGLALGALFIVIWSLCASIRANDVTIGEIERDIRNMNRKLDNLTNDKTVKEFSEYTRHPKRLDTEKRKEI